MRASCIMMHERIFSCTVAGVTTATTEDAGGLAAHSLSSISIGFALFVLLNVVTHYGLCGRGPPYRGGYFSLSLGTTLEPRSGRRSGPDLPAARPQSGSVAAHVHQSSLSSARHCIRVWAPLSQCQPGILDSRIFPPYSPSRYHREAWESTRRTDTVEEAPPSYNPC